MNNLSNRQCGNVMVIFTSSWRYLASASLLAFICQFILYIYSFDNWVYLFVNSIIFIISHYYIFRLWFDNQLFQVLYQQDDCSHFDFALQYLFPKKQIITNMHQRWDGTKKLFNYALSLVVIHWVWLIVSMIMMRM